MYDTDHQVAVEAADVLDEASEDEVSFARAEGPKEQYVGDFIIKQVTWLLPAVQSDFNRIHGVILKLY